MQQEHNNLTAGGYINGRSHIFAIDTGASQSIIRRDLVKNAVEALYGVSLRTATGELATVYGKVKVKVTIANISVSHVFIVADIVDEVIIGADFMISHGINLHMGQKVMIWQNVEIPLDIGYESKTQVRKLVITEQQEIPPQSEALLWAHLERDCEDNSLRAIEPTEIKRDFSIDHRIGGKHGNANALSRRPCKLECKHCTKAEGKECLIDVRRMQINSSEDWSVAQRNDDILAKIMSAKEQDRRPTRNEIFAESPLMKSYWAQWNSLKLINGCLYRTWESADGKTSKNLLVVPTAKINEIMDEFHSGLSGGHLGVTKTLEKVKQRFYWVGCQQTVADWIANCTQCIARKGPVRNRRGQLHQYLNERHEFVRNRIKTTSDKMKARYDRAANSKGYNEGQLVLLFNPQRKIGLSPKLQTHWDGPYTVIKRINDVVYRIQKHKSPRSKMKVVHLERLADYGKGEFVSVRDEQT